MMNKAFRVEKKTDVTEDMAGVYFRWDCRYSSDSLPVVVSASVGGAFMAGYVYQRTQVFSRPTEVEVMREEEPEDGWWLVECGHNGKVARLKKGETMYELYNWHFHRQSKWETYVFIHKIEEPGDVT